jgi:hypothetical protein
MQKRVNISNRTVLGVTLGIAFAGGSVLLPRTASAQRIQLGLGGTLGSGGIGLEADVAHTHAGAFVRGTVSPNTSARTVGIRTYLFGRRGSSFYVSGAHVSVKCAAISWGETATGCDGETHEAWALLLGVESDGENSGWSFFADGGPYLKLENAPGIKPWTAAAGIRFRIP